MRLQRYFDRIGYRGASSPTRAVLTALQKAHLGAVPFENLDVQLGRPVTTRAEDAYEKIVIGKRGGWCYEHNGLFGWALGEIGFDVMRIAASVMRQQRGPAAEANHLCLQVSVPDANDRYLVDVGFGGSMLEPILLAEAEHLQAPFRIGLRKLPDQHWRFWEDIGDGEFGFDFVAEPASESLLANKCVFLQTDPSSSFVLNLVAQLRLPGQHKTLRGRVFSVASEAGIGSTILGSAEELVTTLAEHFFLDAPEIADLWPRITARHEALMREKTLGDTYEIRARPHNESLG